MHRAWSFGAEALESGGGEWVATGGEDDVGGVGCELANHFEAEAAGATGSESWDGFVSLCQGVYGKYYGESTL